MTNSEDIYWLLLTYESKLKPKQIKWIISQCYERLHISLEQFYNLPDSQLLSDFELTETEIRDIHQSKTLAAGQAFLLESLEEQNVTFLKSIDPRYPVKLKTSLPDNHPPLLFCLGNLEMFDKKIVAIIGQRDAHLQNLKFVRASAEYLASQQIVVVSGFAKGVDQEAYLGAVNGSGQTIVVLAEGILSAKSAFRKISSSIEDGQVTVVSQFHPNIPWQTWTAMSRNQVVVGLADVTLVGQTKTDGGTWHGATIALKLPKPVFIFKNPDTDLAGADKLISKGALPIEPTTDTPIPDLLVPVMEACNDPAKFLPKNELEQPDTPQLELLSIPESPVKPKKPRKKKSNSLKS